MSDRFEELLAELGKTLNIALKSDKNHFCTLQIQPELLVQFQTDAAFEKLLIISKVAEIPPGKFRENVLREALKANGQKDPKVGVFAYISQTNHLVLFQRYPFDLLNGTRLAELLGPFIETIENWKTAIASGQASPPILQ